MGQFSYYLTWGVPHTRLDTIKVRLPQFALPTAHHVQPCKGSLPSRRSKANIRASHHGQEKLGRQPVTPTYLARIVLRHAFQSSLAKAA